MMLVACWRDVCQHIGVGLNHGDLAESRVVSALVVNEVIEVTEFMWGGGGGGCKPSSVRFVFQWDCSSGGPLC